MDASYLSSSLRPGHPDFLDLPWDRPVAEWGAMTPRIVELPRGESRHPVVFVSYDARVYALKELPPRTAAKEYEALRRMEELRLPVVAPVGHIRTRTVDGEASVLVTRYLDHALPYGVLFQRGSLSRYRDHLLDAMASLLVQLHLAGVYWGDCSPANTLFRRDAGALQAYLVDAETSEVRPALAEGLRSHDLDIMEENVCGRLADLAAEGILPEEFPVFETGAYVRSRYEALWQEITREELLVPGESYRLYERVKALNTLGFSVDELVLEAAEGGARLRLRAFVTDRNFHRHMLQSLTGLDVEEMQARQMVNEIQQSKAALSETHNRSVPLSVAAHSWLTGVYVPAVERLRPLLDGDAVAAELYCEVLEHKWYLSEQAHGDVGLERALESYLALKGVS